MTTALAVAPTSALALPANRFEPALIFPDYLAHPALHFSTLSAMARSPRAYLHATRVERADTDALSVGRAIHAMTLTSDPGAFVVYPGAVRRGKEWEAFATENAHLYIVTGRELETAAAVAGAVHDDPVAAPILTGGAPEVSGLWEYEGETVKVRYDYLRTGDDVIVELKSTRYATARAFLGDYFRRAYHVQAGIYAEGYRRIVGREPRMYTIAAQNCDELDVAVYPIPSEVLSIGWDTGRKWIDTVRECRASGKWPGVAGGKLMAAPEIPAWMLGQALDMSGLEVE